MTGSRPLQDLERFGAEWGVAGYTTVMVDAGTQQVVGVDARVDFDPNYLEVVGITGGSALPITLLNSFENSKGTIDFAAGTLSSPAPSGTFTLATIEFRAKAKTAGTELTFSQTSSRNTGAAYGGSSVLGSVSGATVAI